jgi:hypothetical protein
MAPTTPSRSETADVFDPLRTPKPDDGPGDHGFQDATQQPFSFKRRTPSNYQTGPFASLLQSRLASPSRGMAASNMRKTSSHFGGRDDESVGDDDDVQTTPRTLFSRRQFSSLARGSLDALSAFSGRSHASGRPPPIPNALPHMSIPRDSTPLPLIPIVVLCICMLSEFLSASVTSPFIFFMIEVRSVSRSRGCRCLLPISV